ncbi:MAG TPA: CopD family protein [Panacibacter sp.]|nr:CopD family protein [Panacibacter sp.]HNP46660.1 CopD family protein [Panacibacter sp.]
MYYYLKALHIIFVITWFAGMFYMPRLFIYNTEAGEKDELSKKVLREQFSIMMKRLWYGITWPSAILTLIFGPWVLLNGPWISVLSTPDGTWLWIKLVFVLLLYVYHFTLHIIFKQEMKGVFKYSSQSLRMWNEVATIFLVAIVTLVTVKQTESFVWSLAGLIGFIFVLMSAIRIYKIIRTKAP